MLERISFQGGENWVVFDARVLLPDFVVLGAAWQ
jgi:hypothetical protein